VSQPDNHRVLGHSNPPPRDTEIKLEGPASWTKDWVTESSRVGFFYNHEDFKLKPHGTWAYESPSNAFDSRLGRK
jgi:hypothetical protein